MPSTPEPATPSTAPAGHQSETSAPLFQRPALNLIETADYLRVCERTVRSLVTNRRLRPARIGRRLIFKRSELDRFLDLQTALAS